MVKTGVYLKQFRSRVSAKLFGTQVLIKPLSDYPSVYTFQ